MRWHLRGAASSFSRLPSWGRARTRCCTWFTGLGTWTAPSSFTRMSSGWRWEVRWCDGVYRPAGVHATGVRIVFGRSLQSRAAAGSKTISRQQANVNPIWFRGAGIHSHAPRLYEHIRRSYIPDIYMWRACAPAGYSSIYHEPTYVHTYHESVLIDVYSTSINAAVLQYQVQL